MPPNTTMWASAPGEPPATVTVAWAVDAHDTTIVDLAGDLCTVTVRRIRDLFSDLADTSAGHVAIDASEVTFVGSRGLSLLLATQSRLAERGLRCRVVSPSSVMRHVLAVAQVDDRLCKGIRYGGPWRGRDAVKPRPQRLRSESLRAESNAAPESRLIR